MRQERARVYILQYLNIYAVTELYASIHVAMCT